jgi:hypothetical protein
VHTGGAALYLVEDWFIEDASIAYAPGARLHGPLPGPAERAWVAARLQPGATIRYVEETCLSPGQMVQVVGRPRLDAHGPCFASGGGEPVDLIDDDEAPLRARLAGRETVGTALIAAGALSALGVVVVALLK